MHKGLNNSFLCGVNWLACSVVFVGCVMAYITWALAADGEAAELPLLVQEDFENGADRWQPVGGSQWEIMEADDGGHAYRMTGKSSYKPPVRSPRIISLLRDVVVSDFEITARVQSTNYNAGNHRDMCIFWGYQDPSHFYYVHFGQKPDPHACQIFIVDGAPRKMITVKKSAGTPWDKAWHDIKVVRRVADGSMEVYFDDMETPVMTAQDKTFTWGQVGIGTFDDNGNWDDLTLRGVVAVRPEK
jgi:hypothetical protein